MKRIRATHFKIAAALLMVLTTAVMTTAILAFFIYERTLSGVVQSRFQFIAVELKKQIESGLDLGLPLGELENMNALLRRHLSSDDALVSLCIVNAKGVVLFDTKPEHTGRQIPVPWLQSSGPNPRETAIALDKNSLALPILTNYGKVVGGLVLTYSQDLYTEKKSRTARELAESTFIVLLISGAVGFFGVFAIGQPLEFAVVRLETRLRSVLLRIRGGAAPIDLDADSDGENEIIAFERNVVTAIHVLDRMENRRTRRSEF